MAPNTIAIVTGANKNGSLLIYLTARSQERGESALQGLLKDDQLLKAKALTQDGGLTEIKYHSLDIANLTGIREFREYLSKEHPEGIDVVVNNAGIAMTGFDSNVVKTTLQCNYYGTLETSRALLPLIKPNGRLINIASISGSLSKYSTSIRERFLSSNSVSDVTALMEDFKSAVDAGDEKEQGWPSAAYAVSKAGIIGMTRALAKEEKEAGGTRLINSCCPGWVVTDMTKGRGTKSPDQGATTPVMLALEEFGGRVGEFWRDERVLEW